MVETIRKARLITLKELSEKWSQTDMSGGSHLSRTSFARYRDDLHDMFGIIVECKRPGGYGYYIYNERVLEEDSVQNWMYSTISISELLHERKRLFDRILLERVPSADIYLQRLLQAMYDNRKLSMTYRPYGSEESTTRTCCPYALKLSERRWYVVMAIEKEGIVHENLIVFSLDRILHLEILQETFKMPADFSAAEFFRHCFGVVAGDGTEPVTIRLRAFGRERFAMRDLPIHHSQQLVAATDEYFDFEVYLKPTSDFKARLASKGQWLVVLSPQQLADDVVQIHREALEKYALLTRTSLKKVK